MQAEPTTSQPAEETASSSSTPAVQVYEGTRLVGTYPLTRQGLTLGRDAANDISIPSPHASRRHAHIIRKEGCWCLEDLGSTNGTFVYAVDHLLYNSRRQAGPWVLADQQEIRLGPHPGPWRLIFADATTTDQAPPVYINEQRRQVWIRGLPLHLPRDQYVVLLALYKRAPYPCTYDELCAALDADRHDRNRPTYTELAAAPQDSLQHLLHRLRARIEPDPKQPQLILQEPHVGYRLHNEDTTGPAAPDP